MNQSVSARPRLHGNPNLAGNWFRTVSDSGESLEWVRMTTQERELADRCLEVLAEGRIPGPSELNELIGRRRDHNLHGRHSKIRRAVFLGAGLLEPYSPGNPTGRWAWPAA